MIISSYTGFQFVNESGDDISGTISKTKKETLNISDIPAYAPKYDNDLHMLDCSQSFLNPVIDFNATIDFCLDLTKVTDFSSFKTGSYTLTMNNGHIYLP